MLVHVPIILTIFCIFLSFMVTPYFIYPAAVLVISTLFRIVPGESHYSAYELEQYYGKGLAEYRSRRQLFALFTYTLIAILVHYISRSWGTPLPAPQEWGMVISCILIFIGTIVVTNMLAYGRIAIALLPDGIKDIARPRHDHW